MENNLMDIINGELQAVGLQVRGRALPVDSESLFLIGSVGDGFFRHFKQSEEYKSGNPDPLDSWSKRIIDSLCDKLPVQAEAIYPFDKPPQPFQQWAMACDDVFKSPLGILIHKDYGLWHAYRGAIKLALETSPVTKKTKNPCDSCTDKPCLSACPVGAFDGEGYDVPACRAHLQSGHARPCFDSACLARRNCPVGKQFAYAPEVANFFMSHFCESVL